ncbi:MAG: heparan-alpha-glucosaminide N-acetyltransferase domain-containing protein [Ginsengibacter sp.]
MQSSRIRAIDAGRGVAMIFVFLAHFVEYYLNRYGKISQLQNVFTITHLASPTFMLISGTMLGYLFYTKKENFGPTRRKYIDRGLFLLTIAHVLIRISWIPMIQFAHGSHRTTFITDTIGLCLIIGAIGISRISMRNRIILALVLYCISWFVVSFHNPKNSFLEILAELFCGELHNTYFFDNFPFLPWLSLYLIGTTIGEKIGYYQKNGSKKRINQILWKSGAFSLLAGEVLLKIVYHTNIRAYLHFDMTFFSSLQKDPPGIIYFLFYGGYGLLLLWVLNKLVEKKLLTGAIYILEIIGKNSLFAFIIQYYIYFSILIWIDPPYSSFWPIFFLATLIIQIIVIKLWDVKGFNRYLTVLDIPYKKIFILRKKKLL